MPQKKESEIRKKINQAHEENEYVSVIQNQNRARAYSVGSAGGGILELSMRSDTSHLWYLLNPVEAVEMIQSVAALCGLEIALRPKKDFSTWRTWDATVPDFSHAIGSAPHQLNFEQKEYLTEYQQKNLMSVKVEEEEVKSLTESKVKE